VVGGWWASSGHHGNWTPKPTQSLEYFPRLARAAERAGWADSARFYWKRYVTTVSLDRLATDQWFLAMAYRRLAESYALAGDAAKAGEYRTKREKLWVNADSAMQRPQ
jgi:hypothetical protein